MNHLQLISVFLLTLLQRHASFAFVPNYHHAAAAMSSSSLLHMGLFDDLLKNAFSNEKYTAPPEGIKATARHILVKSPDDVNMVLEQLQNGNLKFADAALQFSTCPSSSQGGSLGSFPPGRMVPEFDAVIFDPKTPVGEVVGPVPTKFGYHLIVVDKRTGV